MAKKRDPRFEEARKLLQERAGLMSVWHALPAVTRGAVCHALLERAATIDRKAYVLDDDFEDVELFHDVLDMNAEAYRIAVSILKTVAEADPESEEEDEMEASDVMELPSVLMDVWDGHSVACASGATSDAIEWSIRAEAEGPDRARCVVHVGGQRVADITVHEQPTTGVPLLMEVQETCAALVWSAIRACRIPPSQRMAEGWVTRHPSSHHDTPAAHAADRIERALKGGDDD